MPIFYKGAGVGTHWHTNDARNLGFTARNPGIVHSTSQMMKHITTGTTYSPYISTTLSYGVAWSYAVFFGLRRPTRTNPGYIYEIDFGNSLPTGVQIYDPIKEVANHVSQPLQLNPPYQHDGQPNFLLGVVDPRRMQQFLQVPILQPPPQGQISRTPRLTDELDTLVRVLRDAEILVLDQIPANYVTVRYPVW
jgi:hypothetical protein